MKRYACSALKVIGPPAAFLAFVAWVVSLHQSRPIDHRTMGDHRARCREFEQPYDGGCVSNEEWIERNLADEVRWTDEEAQGDQDR